MEFCEAQASRIVTIWLKVKVVGLSISVSMLEYVVGFLLDVFYQFRDRRLMSR